MKEDFKLYIPGPLDRSKPLFEDWPEFVKSFYNCKGRMLGISEDDEARPRFQIGVLCRLRSGKAAPTEEFHKEVVLPLHQRVKLLKERFPQITSSTALRAIMEDRGRPPLQDHYC